MPGADPAETQAVGFAGRVTCAGKFHAAVEALMHLDTEMRTADPLLARREVDDQRAEANRVVIAHRAPELEAEHLE